MRMKQVGIEGRKISFIIQVRVVGLKEYLNGQWLDFIALLIRILKRNESLKLTLRGLHHINSDRWLRVSKRIQHPKSMRKGILHLLKCKTIENPIAKQWELCLQL